MRVTAPLFWGPRGDPNRRLIGSSIFDTETGQIESTVTDDRAKAFLGGSFNVAIESVLPPDTVLAKDATITVRDPTDE